MIKLMEGVTKRLRQVIFGRKNKERWYEVYLACFILLESLEKTYSLQVFYSGINEHMVSYHSTTPLQAGSTGINMQRLRRVGIPSPISVTLREP